MLRGSEELEGTAELSDNSRSAPRLWIIMNGPVMNCYSKNID